MYGFCLFPYIERVLTAAFMYGSMAFTGLNRLGDCQAII